MHPSCSNLLSILGDSLCLKVQVESDRVRVKMRIMCYDPKQVVAAFLTLSMFGMLGNMVKRDHLDPMQLTVPGSSSLPHDVMKVEEHSSKGLVQLSRGPWKEKAPDLKPCWTHPESRDAAQSKGFISFSLTNGPEYHISQVTDAVVVARYLAATLVLPDIRGSELGQKRRFEDMYDVDKFMKSMDGVVNIVRELPAEVASGKPATVRVPNRVSEEYMAKNIQPIFHKNNYLRLAIVFPSTSSKPRERKSDSDSTSCLAMFGSLELKPEIREVAGAMVESLRNMSSDGHFIAVDLRVDDLDKKGCKESGGGKKSCYNAQEVAEFLKRIGFDGNATIYLTQTRWDESLNIFKETFPKTYTKNDIIPADKKGKFLKSGSNELEKALDVSICSLGDVFVPAISGLFYENVVGKRIVLGRTEIIVPTQESRVSGGTGSDFLSSYVSEKNHLAYSCHC